MASYAEQGPADFGLDFVLPAAMLDLGGSAVGAFNALNRSSVRRNLLQSSSRYRSEVAVAALTGGAPPSDAMGYQLQIKRLRELGYMDPGRDSLVNLEILRRMKETEAAGLAAVAQAQRKRDAARTSTQSSSAAKHLRTAWKSLRWTMGFTESTYGGGDVADSVLAYRDSVSNPFQGPRSQWAPNAYPMRTSTPHRIYEDPVNAYRADSAATMRRLVAMRDVSTIDIASQHRRRSDARREGFASAIDEGTRRLIDDVSTETTPGLRGVQARFLNRGGARAIIQNNLDASRDSIMRDTRRSLDARRFSADSLVMASGFQGVRPVTRDVALADPSLAGVRAFTQWIGSKLLPLNSWERRQLEIDTLQAAQRRAK